MYFRLKTSQINGCLFFHSWEWRQSGGERSFWILEGSVRSRRDKVSGASSSILAKRTLSQNEWFLSMCLIFIEFFFLITLFQASILWSLFLRSLASDLHISTNFILLCSAYQISVISNAKYSDSKRSGELTENKLQKASTNSTSWHICTYLSHTSSLYF